jgi:TldD protein
MTISRRDFVWAGMTAAGLAAASRPLLAQLGPVPEPVPPIDDPRLKTLIARALDAARAAGAAYADVRLTHGRERRFDVKGSLQVIDAEDMAAGVRALVDGYWGFASSPVWSPDEMARLGREAVAQARTNALGKPRRAALAPVAPVKGGSWVTPVTIDPFEVHPTEVEDVLRGLAIFLSRMPGTKVENNRCTFVVQDKACGSTEGSYFAQRIHHTEGGFAFTIVVGDRTLGAGLRSLARAGRGWEMYRHAPLREEILREIEELRKEAKLPLKPIDVGRYDTAFDGVGVAVLLDQTIGRATQLDRALGYEANAGGTSYLDAPLEMLGTYRAGAPLLTVTADRSHPTALATVKWDDEGVEPREFPLVREGVLVDYQTTRESAAWLADGYARLGKPVRSHGCAAAPAASFAPMQHSPNLSVVPAPQGQDFDSLVAGLTEGIAVRSGWGQTDFQCLNGWGGGRLYEVKRGKRVALIPNGGFLFRAPELWKSLLALGGAASVERVYSHTTKGEPTQEHYHDVRAPAALFKQLTFIDPKRKA